MILSWMNYVKKFRHLQTRVQDMPTKPSYFGTIYILQYRHGIRLTRLRVELAKLASEIPALAERT